MFTLKLLCRCQFKESSENYFISWKTCNYYTYNCKLSRVASFSQFASRIWPEHFNLYFCCIFMLALFLGSYLAVFVFIFGGICVHIWRYLCSYLAVFVFISGGICVHIRRYLCSYLAVFGVFQITAATGNYYHRTLPILMGHEGSTIIIEIFPVSYTKYVTVIFQFKLLIL